MRGFRGDMGDFGEHLRALFIFSILLYFFVYLDYYLWGFSLQELANRGIAWTTMGS